MSTKPHVKSSLKTISPRAAAEMLERNTHNRSLRETLVDAYAQDMRNGHWLPNNQGIAIAEDGTLLDGQHRLSAVVRAGVSVPMLVVSNLPETGANGVKLRTIDTIDVGKTRGLGDLLALGHNMENANTVAAMARVIIELAVGYKNRITMPVLLQTLRVYRGSIDRVLTTKKFVSGLTNAPVLGALAFAAKAFPDEVAQFSESLFSGENLRAGSPILHLRNFLLSGKAKYKKGHKNTIIARATLSALMHHVEGRMVVTRLKYGAAGHEYFRENQEAAIAKVAAIFTLPEAAA